MKEIKKREINGVVLETTEKPRKLTKSGDSIHATLPAKILKILKWTVDTKINIDLVWDPKLGPVLLFEKAKKEEKN